MDGHATPLRQHHALLLRAAHALGYSVKTTAPKDLTLGDGTVPSPCYAVEAPSTDQVEWVGATQQTLSDGVPPRLVAEMSCDKFDLEDAHEHLAGVLARGQRAWRLRPTCWLCQRDAGAAHDCNGLVQVVYALPSGETRLGLAYSELRTLRTSAPIAFKPRLYLCLLGKSAVLAWALNLLSMLAAAQEHGKLPALGLIGDAPFAYDGGRLKVTAPGPHSRRVPCAPPGAKPSKPPRKRAVLAATAGEQTCSSLCEEHVCTRERLRALAPGVD